MHDFFGFLMLAAFIAFLVSLALLVHAFFRKKTYRPRLIFSGIAFSFLVLSAIGFGMTISPEERAAIEQKRIAKQAQEAQEQAERDARKAQESAEKEAKKVQEAAEREAKKAQEQAEKEAKKAQTATEKKQKDEQEAATKKQKAEQDAKAKEQAAADAAAQKVYDDQAKYEAWLKSAGVIGTIPGLGDRISVFEQKHKRSKGNDPDSYDDNLLSVMKDEGRILFITVNAFGRPLDPDVVVTPLLPIDGVRISFSDDWVDQYLKRNTFVGHSDILEIVVPESEGYYTRMDVYDTPTGNYLYTNIFTGKPTEPDTP